MERELDQGPQTVEAPLGLFRSARLTHLHLTELEAVRWQVRLGRKTIPRLAATLLNRLGDGWLYLVAIMALLVFDRTNFLIIVPASALAAGLAHLIYPKIKRRVARLRPFEADPSMAPLSRPLDRYAFPSGHCMTVTAVMTPISCVHSAMILPTIALCLAIGWARLVAAHHYPSDTAAGFVLGLACSLPFGLYLA